MLLLKKQKRMDLSNGYNQGQDPSFTNKLIDNYSTVLTANSITNGKNLSTTEAQLFAISNKSSSTKGPVFDAEASWWLYAIDILDKFVFACACFALIFNFSNIFIIIISKLHLKTTYKLFISQASSNIVTALSMGMGYISAYYFTGETKLVIAISSYNIVQIGSMACVLTYTLISLELYYKINLPFKHRYMGFTFKVALFLSWLIPVILTESIQIGITLSQMAPNETFLMTYVRLGDNTLGYLNTGLALICLIVIIYLNIASLKTVYRSLQSNPRDGRGKQKSTITIIAMVSTYIIFYLPNWIGGIIFVLHYKYQVLILASLTMAQRRFLVTCLSNLKILNTVSDPVIYVLRIHAIRNTYKKLIIKIKCCEHNHNTNVDNFEMTSNPGGLYREKDTTGKCTTDEDTRISIVSKASEFKY